MNHFLAREDFPHLLRALTQAGYDCVGPQIRQGAIVFDHLHSVTQLPQGFQDEQQPAHYRLQQTDSPYWFDWSNGASAIKPYTFAPQENLWAVQRDQSGRLRFQATLPQPQKTAIIGVRACDLAALTLQDQHFLHGKHVDPYYQARRESLLLIGVNCTHAAATCFCVSTGDGPEIRQPYDLLLSEIAAGFLLSSGSTAGATLAAQLPLTPPVMRNNTPPSSGCKPRPSSNATCPLNRPCLHILTTRTGKPLAHAVWLVATAPVFAPPVSAIKRWKSRIWTVTPAVMNAAGIRVFNPVTATSTAGKFAAMPPTITANG